jgi:hypothetical protein
MPRFVAKMRVISVEDWEVEAASREDARRKLEDMASEVDMNEEGGEIVNWIVQAIKEA